MLFALVLVCAIVLTVLWNVVLVEDYNTINALVGGHAPLHTAYIVVGSFLLLAIIVLSTTLSVELFASLRWTQRQSNFLASVSHELKSPLASIRLFAQTLSQPNLSDEDRDRFAGKILIDADRLNHIIANILFAAEADRRKDALTVAPGELNFLEYLRGYVEEARTIYADKLEIELVGEEVFVEIDPIMFRQVLDNLVDNAIRYRGKHAAHVELRLVAVGPWTELQVVDRGIGIPPERLENIFERFYQIEEGRPPTGRLGMGIGLNVVRSIVKSHKGTVGARSEGRDTGTTVWIRLPTIKAVETETVTA